MEKLMFCFRNTTYCIFDEIEFHEGNRGSNYFDCAPDNDHEQIVLTGSLISVK